MRIALYPHQEALFTQGIKKNRKKMIERTKQGKDKKENEKERI